ncbi:hypothetical protein [Frondihabitans australicus]|uniref:Uncharacterized protein n=1 Tax=Frondihabitans australicus TaxID=386892 RepID=A0A495IF65_9MICO|nr:hypothetical protein [Frondihabitans australicus]RKR74637.1 hypothetical protein C8E83_1761 [Frondihabitans australicus]
MTPAIRLPDSLSLDDLHTFLGRALPLDEGGAVRLIATPSEAGGGVLAAYVGVLSPAGILDDGPTVLGLRTYALAGGETLPASVDPGAGAAADHPAGEPAERLDAVVPLRAIVDRTTRLRNDVVDPTAAVTISLPPQVVAASWAAISPPRGGWAAHPAVDPALLESVAKAGIDEVAAAIPSGTGEQIVQRVRSSVWSREVEGAAGVVSGAAFAALTLGFLGAAGGTEPVRVFSTGSWMRLSTSRGHVLVKRRGRLL